MADSVQSNDVSDWMLSVAAVLPHPRNSPPPYTLAEAVAELGAYAGSVDSSDWIKKYSVRLNRESLYRELEVQRTRIGVQLGERVDKLVAALMGGSDREATMSAAASFDKTWQSEAAKSDAFEDLCVAAKNPATTSDVLRQLAGVVASQLGAGATSYFSPLRDAADAMAASEEGLTLRHNGSFRSPLDESERLRMAREALSSITVGRVVVWAAYARATAVERDRPAAVARRRARSRIT